MNLRTQHEEHNGKDTEISRHVGDIPRALIMRGRAEWDSNIKILTDPIFVNFDEWYNEMENGIIHNKTTKCCDDGM